MVGNSYYTCRTAGVMYLNSHARTCAPPLPGASQQERTRLVQVSADCAALRACRVRGTCMGALDTMAHMSRARQAGQPLHQPQPCDRAAAGTSPAPWRAAAGDLNLACTANTGQDGQAAEQRPTHTHHAGRCWSPCVLMCTSATMHLPCGYHAATMQSLHAVPATQHPPAARWTAPQAGPPPCAASAVLGALGKKTKKRMSVVAGAVHHTRRHTREAGPSSAETPPQRRTKADGGSHFRDLGRNVYVPQPSRPPP
jgi:hypothetical protein